MNNKNVVNNFHVVKPGEVSQVVDVNAVKLHNDAEREAIMSGRAFSQTYIPIPGMWTAINW